MARPKKGKFGFSEKYSFRPILSEKKSLVGMRLCNSLKLKLNQLAAFVHRGAMR